MLFRSTSELCPGTSRQTSQVGLAIPRPIEEGLTMPNLNPVRRSVQDALFNTVSNPEFADFVNAAQYSDVGKQFLNHLIESAIQNASPQTGKFGSGQPQILLPGGINLSAHKDLTSPGRLPLVELSKNYNLNRGRFYMDARPSVTYVPNMGMTANVSGNLSW